MPKYQNNIWIVSSDQTFIRADAAVSTENLPDGLKLGEALAEPSDGCPFLYRIYTREPSWRGGGEGEEAILKSCCRQVLELALELNCSSVLLPLLGAGSAGFPPEKALEITVRCIEEFLELQPDFRVILSISGEADRRLSEVFVPGANLFPGKREKEDACLSSGTSAGALSQAAPKAKRRKASFFGNSAEKAAPMQAAECCGAMPREEADFLAADVMPEATVLQAEAMESYSPEQDDDPLLGESLAHMILRLGEEAGMTDPQIYKAANLSRAAFNKIINGKTVNPSRQTVAAIAIALKLDYPTASELMAAAGLAFADNSAFDVIVKSCIQSGFYDLWKINCALAGRNLPILGSGSY